jgi:hypothetical protein
MEPKVVSGPTVTFDEIVRLAFPDKAGDQNTTFTVTFRKAQGQPHDGAMVEGDTVEIKQNGTTSFTVVHATKS